MLGLGTLIRLTVYMPRKLDSLRTRYVIDMSYQTQVIRKNDAYSSTNLGAMHCSEYAHFALTRAGNND